MNKFQKNYEVNLDEILAQPTTLSPAEYQYYKGLENRRIIINEGISENIIELASIPFHDMCNDDTGKPIEIILNTVGGSVYDGFTLIEEILKAKVDVTIRVMGMCASMGALIAMSHYGKENVKTICGKFSVGLIHSGSQYMEGTTHAVKDLFKFSEQYEKRITDYILSHTKISPEMYEKIERQEYWMDADEMLRLGVVSEIE